MSEANEMVQLEKARLNVWNVGVVVVAALIQAFALGVIYSKQKGADEKAVESIAVVREEIKAANATIKEIQLELPQITQLQYQMTRQTEIVAENRKGIEATNARVDRVVESFGGKLDGLVENVNKIATRVEVIANQVGAAKPQRTRFSTSIVPEIIQQ